MDPDEMTPAARARKMMGEKKIKIVKESIEKKKSPLKFKILKENDAEKGIEILKKELNLTDNDFKKINSKSVKILVPRPERKAYANRIDQIEDFTYDVNMPGSSIGGIKYKDNIKFSLKPVGAQGRASAGTENEDVLVNEVKKYLAEGAKNTRYKELVLKLSEKIKKRDFAPELTYIPFKDEDGNIRTGINQMWNEKEKKKVTGIIITDLPDNEEKSIIFGSDNAVIIYKTYTPKDFELKGENLFISVNKILTDLKQIEEFDLEPVVNIRKDVTRRATGGIRATVQPKNKIYRDNKLIGDKIELSYNEVMK